MIRMSRKVADVLLRYGIALGLVALATVATKLLQPIIRIGMTGGETISPLFFAAVVLAAWYGGWGPSMLATAASGWASAHFFPNYPYGVEFWWDDLIRLSVFLLTAVFISFLTSFRKRAEEALQRSHDNLERRVNERTAELRASHERLRESEERFRILVEGVADYALVLLDATGRVASWNAGAQRLYGYASADIVGRPASCFFADEDPRRKQPMIPSGPHGSRRDRNEEEGWRVRKDGSRFWANVITTRLTNQDGQSHGFAQVTRDATELRKLEREVLEISEAEQHRFGHDLHDGLGQELTGLAFLTQNLGYALASRGIPESVQADRIVGLINGAIEQTREMARGFSPVEMGPDGLRAALRDLTYRVETVFEHPCLFECEGDTRVEPDSAALHLYRIAQEAINNAVRHSRASVIRVHLTGGHGQIVLTVTDDGVGLPAEENRRDGLGLRLMLYRARVIGASLTIEPNPEGGTTVRCAYSNPAPGAPPESVKSSVASLKNPTLKATEHVQEVIAH
jgi:PAS domain S-box-containing protein